VGSLRLYPHAETEKKVTDFAGSGEIGIAETYDDLSNRQGRTIPEREIGRTINNAPGRSAMMQALGALCVAALGGLTITTYRHPKDYQKLYPVLIIIILVSMWTMVAFNIGVHSAESVIWGSGVFEYDNASKATDAIRNVEISDWIMGVLPVALIAYIVFLSTFQYLLTNDKH
jgi:hypothetical protein